jgi:hypothetical protein
MKYRKKPLVVEAEQFIYRDLPIEQVRDFCERHRIDWRWMSGSSDFPVFILSTLEGPIYLQEGDWVVTGIEGEKYPVKDGIFRKTYEPIFEKGID